MEPNYLLTSVLVFTMTFALTLLVIVQSGGAPPDLLRLRVISHGASADRTDSADEIRALLARAGVPVRFGVSEYTRLQAVIVLLMFCLGVVMQIAPASDIVTEFALVLISLVLTLMGYVGPNLLLRRMIASRQRALRSQLPDILDMLIVSVVAGLGFEQAIARIVEKMRGPLPSELGRVLGDIQDGKSTADALRDMADRLDMSEVTMLTMAVIEGYPFNHSNAAILVAARKSLRIARLEAICTRRWNLRFTLLVPFIFFILPAIVIVMMGPAVCVCGNAYGCRY
ncbi:MAG: type II secretion system F family protein [Capsulimonadaceae bacterium]